MKITKNDWIKINRNEWLKRNIDWRIDWVCIDVFPALKFGIKGNSFYKVIEDNGNKYLK